MLSIRLAACSVSDFLPFRQGWVPGFTANKHQHFSQHILARYENMFQTVTTAPKVIVPPIAFHQIEWISFVKCILHERIQEFCIQCILHGFDLDSRMPTSYQSCTRLAIAICNLFCFVWSPG